jgi:hypothetical protein
MISIKSYFFVFILSFFCFNSIYSSEGSSWVESGYFFINGNPRNGNNKEITIPIAYCSHIPLNQENLIELFHLINHYTINTQYPCDELSPIIDGKIVHRPNHNGTHSLRQVRLIEALFDLIEQEGTEEGRNHLAILTEDEKLNIMMAAFFLRAGRVDESSHKDPLPDDYNTRSALIYEAYAEQLKVDPELREWIRNLIIDSCKPLELCIEANKNSKSLFVYSLLTTAHECDLVRCFDKYTVEKNKWGAIYRMYAYTTDPTSHVEILFDWAIQLCKATGNRIVLIGDYGNSKLFAESSLDGKICWENLQQVKNPDWD